MALSDALSEAVEAIDEYINGDFYSKEFYDDDVVKRARAIRDATDDLRRELDSPPLNEGIGESTDEA